jgi:hypothetical protein
MFESIKFPLNFHASFKIEAILSTLLCARGSSSQPRVAPLRALSKQTDRTARRILNASRSKRMETKRLSRPLVDWRGEGGRAPIPHGPAAASPVVQLRQASARCSHDPRHEHFRKHGPGLACRDDRARVAGDDDGIAVHKRSSSHALSV